MVYVVKALNFADFPPYPMDFRAGRHYMGIAYKVDHDNLTLATYGEWHGKEGGAGIRLRVDVPKGLVVRKAPKLSGEDSIADGPEPRSLDTPELKKCYWYGPREPGPEWHVIKTRLDTDLTEGQPQAMSPTASR
jgi:hypothetical protein